MTKSHQVPPTGDKKLPLFSSRFEKLRRLYDSAYSDPAKRYPHCAAVVDTLVLDSIDGSAILTTAIVNRADTELANFLRNPGAIEWMRQSRFFTLGL